MRAHTVCFLKWMSAVILAVLVYFYLVPLLWLLKGDTHHTEKVLSRQSAEVHSTRESDVEPQVSRSSNRQSAEISYKRESDVKPEESGSSSAGRIVVDNTTALLKTAQEMHRQYGVVLFTVINDAFLDFAFSWCCNTRSMQNVHQHVLFLTTDVQTARRLQAVCVTVTVAVFTSPHFQGVMDYSRANYVRLMVERTRFIQQLLEAGVGVLVFEVDSMWLENPLPLLLSRQDEGDILATKVSGTDVTAGGFIFLNPTSATVKFWEQLTVMMDDLHRKIQTYTKTAMVSEALNDQQFFSQLAKKKFAGIRIIYLPAEAFPDGKWYLLPEKKRQSSRPVLINNNWIIGTSKKRQRAKAFQHWFWDEAERKCNTSALHNMGVQ